MRIGEVIGTITLSRWHPSLTAGSYRLVVPLSSDNLRGDMTRRAEAIVVYDELNAGRGHQIAISEGQEAAAPFFPQEKPVDAYNAALLDHLDL